MDIVEQAKIRLVIDCKDAVNELGVIDAKISSLREKQKEYAKGTVEYKQLNGEIRELEKSYKLVEQRMDITKMTMNQLTAYQRDLNKEIRTLDPASDAYTQTAGKIREVSARQQELNGMVKQQRSIWDDAKAGVLAFLAAFTFQRAIDFVVNLAKEGFALVTSLDRMHMALRNVSGSSEQYRVNLEFVRTLSNAYGQDLSVLTKTYTSFLASTNSTNLSLQAKQRIYESIIKAGSALMLSNEEIEGSLVAVSQMFSKGNVSAEELRGQLGERLPGAFGIMAKALGVNEQQLNKMLEQGQVLAEDALPKFAKALEETYGEKAKANLQTVAGQMNRLYTYLTNQAVAWNENVGGTRKLAAAIGFLVDNISTIINVVKVATAGWIAYEVVSRRTALLEVLKTGYLKAKNLVLGEALLAQRAYTGAMIVETEAQMAATTAARSFNAALMANPFAVVLTALTALWGGYQIYKGMVEDAQVQQNELNKRVADAVTPLVQERLEFNSLAKEVLNSNNKLEDRKAKLDELKKKYPDNLKGINDLADAERYLGLVIRNTNADFLVRAKMLENEVKMNYNNELATKAINERIQLENKLKNADTRTVNMVTGTAGIVKAYDSEAESIKKLIAAKDKVVSVTMKNNADLAKYSENLTKKLNYDYEEQIKGQNRVTTNDGKNKKELALSSQELYLLELEMKKDFEAKIKKIDDAYTKWLFDEYQERKKVIDKAVSEIEKNITKIEEQEAKAKGKIKKELQDRIKAYHEERKEIIEKENQITGAQIVLEKDQSEIRKQIMGEAFRFAGDLLTALHNNLDRQMELATTSLEKAVIENKKAWLNVADSALGALDNLANGNFVGAIVGGIRTVFTALNNWVTASHDLEMAKLEDLKVKLKEAGEEFMKLAETFITADDVSRLKEVYAELVKITELPPVRYDMGTYEQRLTQELEIGAKITDNYNKAVEKENGLFEVAKSNEEKLHQDAIDKINKQYDAAIAGINKKFDWEQQMANRIFDLQSLGIQRQTNEELWALVTNNDTKLSLTSEYEGKKASIMAAFASQIKPITADMSQAEIDGINRATEARDAQLAKLEGWLTDELSFVINNEGQKRKEYSATETIIRNGQERLNDLAIEHAAADIKRQTDRNVALAAAEAKKKTDTEAAEKSHLERMEALATAHNDRLVALGKAKDEALAESFRMLNDIIKNGYDEIIAKAQAAFAAGEITAEQYNQIYMRLFDIKNMLGQIDWSKLSPPNTDFDFTLPRFASGTEYVDPMNIYPAGTDTVPAYLNKGERVLDKELNALLGGISNQELVRRAIGSVSLGSAGLVSKISSSALAGFGFASPTSSRGQALMSPTLRQAQTETLAQPQASVSYHSNFSTGRMEELLTDIHSAIVNKPVLDMGTLGAANDAVAVNVARSRFA